MGCLILKKPNDSKSSFISSSSCILSSWVTKKLDSADVGRTRSRIFFVQDLLRPAEGALRGSFSFSDSKSKSSCSSSSSLSSLTTYLKGLASTARRGRWASLGRTSSSSIAAKASAKASSSSPLSSFFLPSALCLACHGCVAFCGFAIVLLCDVLPVVERPHSHLLITSI